MFPFLLSSDSRGLLWVWPRRCRMVRWRNGCVEVTEMRGRGGGRMDMGTVTRGSIAGGVPPLLVIVAYREDILFAFML